MTRERETPETAESDALCPLCDERPANCVRADLSGSYRACLECHAMLAEDPGNDACTCTACVRGYASATCTVCRKEPTTHRLTPRAGTGNVEVCSSCHVNSRQRADCVCVDCGATPMVNAADIARVKASREKRPPEREPTEEPKVRTMANKKNGKSDAIPIAATMSQMNIDPSAPVERARYKEFLPCEIADGIAHVAGDELAKLIQERAVFLERRKSENAKAREKRAFFDERIEELGAMIGTRTEKRQVECVEYLHPDEKKIVVVRLDTGETVSNRVAEPDDMQEVMPLLDGTGKPIQETKGKGKSGRRTDPEPPFGEEASP